MPKPKKSSEEKRAAQRLYQRERYARIKNDPILYEIEKEKNRKKYLDQKKRKIKVSIKEMTRRNQKAQRAKWKENSKKYLDRKRKERETTQIFIDENETSNLNTYSSDEHPDRILPSKLSSSTSSSCQCKIKIRRLRYKMNKEKKLLEQTINFLRKQNLKYRKQMNKLEEIQSNKEEHDKEVKKKQQVATFSEKRKMVKNFFESDLISYIVPGKNQYIKKSGVRKAKRYLTDSLVNLFKKFKNDYPGVFLSYSSFCRLRPFWVCFPQRNRDTCLCKTHTNMELLLSGLHKARVISERNASQLIKSLCCNEYNLDCLGRLCNSCKSKTVTYLKFSDSKTVVYYQWVTRRENSKTFTSKIKIIEPAEVVLPKLEASLEKFMSHVRNITVQYNSFMYIKCNLKITEAIIHCDWSENYGLKYAKEIQSLHFGGSRQHVSLHTSVVYICDPLTGVIAPRSFCTVSQCLNHTTPAIWAHLQPLLRYIKHNNPHVNTIHFMSDGPTSQYRNKFTFFMISKLHEDYCGLECVTWNYSEAGHGKGAPDGVGGALKTAMDRVVSHGRDIGNFADFLTALKQCNSNIQIEVIDDAEIQKIESVFPSKIPTFKGTSSIHQVLWESNASVMAVRKLSCFLCMCIPSPCLHGKHLGFINIIQDPKQKEPQPPAVTKVVAESKKITVLSDISLNVDNLRVSRKRRFIDEKPLNIKNYNISSCDIAKDFESLIDSTLISQNYPEPSSSQGRP